MISRSDLAYPKIGGVCVQKVARVCKDKIDFEVTHYGLDGTTEWLVENDT